MKKLLLIIGVFLSLAACSDTEYTQDDLTFNGQGQVLEKESNKPIDGYLVEYYGKEAKRARLQFEDGYQVGEATRWYRDGTVKEVGRYELNDKQRSTKDGKWQKFYPTGSLRVEVIYDLGDAIKTTGWCENGTKESYQDQNQHQQWSCEGTLLKESSYDGKGKLNGVAKQWTPEGQLISEIYYDSSIQPKGFNSSARNGSYKTWTSEGKVLVSANYKNDQLDGDYIAYNKEGKLIEKGVYADGKKIGTWTMQPRGWNRKGLITQDYDKSNFINEKYLKAVNNVCNLRSNPYRGRVSKDDSKCLYYLENDLIDPKKKITSYAVGDNGSSDWYYLANHASSGVYDYLKSKGVPVNVADSDGTTRLHVCIDGIQNYSNNKCGVKEVTSLLKDVDINAVNNQNGSALMLAVDKKASIYGKKDSINNVIDLLLANKADLNKTNGENKTALMLALHKEDFVLASKLIDLGADVTLKDSEGFEAIHYVFLYSSGRRFRSNMTPEMRTTIKKMIAKGSSIETKLPDNQTLKEMFIASGAVELAQQMDSL